MRTYSPMTRENMKGNMANRRMFSKSITNSSNFLMMSQSAQNLYFHLGMNADDDGFCEHFTVMRMTESKPDDLRALVERGFVFIFDQKVLIIKDWKENNYIQADRYTPSKYIETYKKEILALSAGNSCIQDVYKADTQVRLGKVSLENKETNKKTVSSSSLKEGVLEQSSAEISEIKQLCDTYTEISEKSFKNYKSLVSNFKFWRESYSVEDMQLAIKGAWLSEYWHGKINPTILLRRTDQKDNAVDRIGEFKDKGIYKKDPNVFREEDFD